MRWLMNINGDIWRQQTDVPLKMIQTESLEIPERIEFLNAEDVMINFPVEKTINDIKKEMIESELETQQTSNTKTKGERE
jgi:hypothetical protein